MRLFRKGPSDEEMRAIQELHELTEDDPQIEKSLGFIEKISDIDMDEMERDIEESRIKLDFCVFGIAKIIGLLKNVEDITNNIEEHDNPVKEIIDNVDNTHKEINEEFSKKVRPIYENNG